MDCPANRDGNARTLLRHTTVIGKALPAARLLPTSTAGHHPARVRLDEQVEMVRLGKTRTGRHLDARTWDDFPRPSSPQSPLPTSSGRTHR